MPGGCYFFTVVIADRDRALLIEHIDRLRHAVRCVKAAKPFYIDAWVVLPDHMHCMWTLPAGDVDFSTRWKDIKTIFSRSLPKTEYVSLRRKARGERGIWQRRFWEHLIRDDRDYNNHIDYIHMNPYKHGLVAHVRDWPYSTFHKYVADGVYAPGWMTEEIDIEGGE